MKNIPEEYSKITKIIASANKQFLFLYNFGPCKILTIEEIEDEKDILTDFYSDRNLYGFDFFPFATIGRNQGVLMYGFNDDKENGIFYAGFYPNTKYPIKISNNFSDIISLEVLQNNLLSEDEIYHYEEQQFNSNYISETCSKGVLPLNNDIRKMFKKQFTKSILIDKDTDYKDTINKFLIENDIEFNDLPEGKYHSSDFEEIAKKIRTEYKIGFFYTQFIPSDFYGIGIYTKLEISELLKLGLLSDEDQIIEDETYKLLI